MNTQKIIILTVLSAAVVGGIVYLDSQKADQGTEVAVTVTPRTPSNQDQMTREDKIKRYDLAKEITTPDGFINTDGKPVTIEEFIGKKVVLIDFWTYSCINCQRTTPYLNAWYEKYKDQGLVIIGIHTPEFEFEKEYQNVVDATKRLGIKYPVVLDNDYSTWNAYKNRFWPRKYLIDIDGYVTYDHIGEGGYEETEKKIQEALTERMAVLGEGGTIDQSLTKETPVQDGAKSPETYFGSDRNENLGNGVRGVAGMQDLSIPSTITKNVLYLGGKWDIAKEYAKNIQAGARIVYKFESKNVHFVAGADGPVEISTLLDGKSTGVRTIQANTLYTLVSNASAGEHTLEIVINNPGLEAYTFTF